MAKEGIKIKIEAEDAATAAIQQVRDNILESLREIDSAGEALFDLVGGLKDLGSSFGSGAGAAGSFAGALDRSTQSVTSMATEIATLASGIKDTTEGLVLLGKSGALKELLSVGGSSALGTGAQVSRLAALQAMGRNGLMVTGAGTAGLAMVAGGTALAGIDFYTDAVEKQTQRNGLVDPRVAYTHRQEWLAAQKEAIGEKQFNAIMRDPALNQLRGLDMGEALDNALQQRFSDARAKQAEALEASQSRQQEQLAAAQAERMRQADLQAKEQYELAREHYKDNPRELKAMELRHRGMSDDNIQGILQQWDDSLAEKLQRVAADEKALAKAEKRSDIDRRMGSSAESWKERILTEQGKRQRDELEVLNLAMAGRISQAQFQAAMDWIGVEYTKPGKSEKQKAVLDLGGDNLYQSRFATRGLGDQTSQADLLRKLLAELKDGNHKQRLQALRMEKLLDQGKVVLGVQGPI